MGRREVYSSGQSLFIRFHSDDSNTGRGFSMMYQAISPPEAHPDTGNHTEQSKQIIFKRQTQGTLYIINKIKYLSWF